MATPFSPFVGRQAKPIIRRRQSELPSDLIDWDAPVIPELEKQRIIYEDYIKELNEDHEIETFLNEHIIKIAHDAIIEEYNNKIRTLEDNLTKERSEIKALKENLTEESSKIKALNKNLIEENSRANLFKGQIEKFENDVKENYERIEELSNELSIQREELLSLQQEKENWVHERDSLKMEIENLNFRNNETTCELNHNLEVYIQKKNEVEDYRKKLDAVKNQLAYYKRLAKNKEINN